MAAHYWNNYNELILRLMVSIFFGNFFMKLSVLRDDMFKPVIVGTGGGLNMQIFVCLCYPLPTCGLFTQNFINSIFSRIFSVFPA